MVTRLNKDRGFTIVELVVVMVVIGILALISVTAFSGQSARARNTKRESSITAIYKQLEAFKAERGY